MEYRRDIMRVFDFDNTIYDGESVFDFYIFSIRYNPKVLKYLFVIIYHIIWYKLGRVNIPELERAIKKYAREYINSFKSIDVMVDEFWDKNIHKIKSWYIPESDDVILTASFDFIMEKLQKRAGIKNCFCSTTNFDTMEIKYINIGENKLKIFQKNFGNSAVADEFYTDSILDMPMIKISKKAFLVKGNKIERINI